MDKAEKYRRSAVANFTPEELAQARTNFERSAKRFPEEHKRTAALIEQKGLGNHREVIDWYRQNISPISEHALGVIGIFADTTYAGAFGKGQQFEGPAPQSASLVSRGGDDVLAETIFRQPIKPEGA